MVKTYYDKNTATHASTSGTYNYDLDATTAAASGTFFIEGAASPAETWIYSATTEPGLATWPGGTYTWYLKITTANSSLNLTTVTLRRQTSALADRATKAATMTTLLSPTGTISGTITWNDGTQNPSGSASNDRFTITFQGTRASGAMNTQTAFLAGGLSTDSRVDTPLEAGATPIDMTPNLVTVVNKVITKV